MTTFLAQNQFIPNPSVISPRTEGSAAASKPPPVADATAAPIHSSDGGVEGHAQSHALGLPPKYNRCGKRKPEGALPEGFGASKDEPAGIKPGPSEAIPTSTGGPQKAPASAPTKNPDAGACNCEYAHCEDFDRPDCKAKAAGLDPWPDGSTDCISEIFFYARKLMKQPPRFVLDEACFLADTEETPLFLREDGYLQRREA